MRDSLVSVCCGALVLACTGYIEAPKGWGAAGASGAAAQGSGAASGSGAGGAAGTGGGAGTGTSGDSCAVLTLLQSRCANCHSSPPIPGVPMALVSSADLAAEAPDYPGVRSVEASISRMQSVQEPMPPPPAAPASASEIAVLESWLARGMPTGCEGGGGTGGNPYDTEVVCSSGKTWRKGNEESPNMRPGGACITCHTRGDGEEEGEGPRFSFAGTVYPTAHEPDDCNGLDGSGEPVRVVVADSDGTTFTLQVNSAGNFYMEERDDIALPYRAKVVAGDRERVMATEQTSGDCNACHTESGRNGAPGRIMAF